jgi:hypothetical protein
MTPATANILNQFKPRTACSSVNPLPYKGIQEARIFLVEFQKFIC